jgi:hypothetical protein
MGSGRDGWPEIGHGSAGYLIPSRRLRGGAQVRVPDYRSGVLLRDGRLIHTRDGRERIADCVFSCAARCNVARDSAAPGTAREGA